MEVDVWARMQALEVALREVAKQAGLTRSIAAALRATQASTQAPRAAKAAEALRAELDRLAAHFEAEA